MFPSGYVWYSIGGIGIADGLVNSWNGLTGIVSVTTAQLPEGSNLYFTVSRAQAAVVTQTITSGVTITAPSEAAVFTALGGKADTVHTHIHTDITDWTSAFASDFTSNFATKNTDNLAEGSTNKYYHSSLFDTDFAGKTTSGLAEGSNLYFTTARAQAAFTAGSNISIVAGVISNTYAYSLPTASATTLGGVKVGSGLSIDGFGVLSSLGLVTSVFGRIGTVIANSGDYNSDQVTEGSTNLYFTIARARTALSATGPVAYSSVSGIISIAQSTTSTDGYLSSTDWNTFNGKQSALTFGNLTEATSSVLTITGATGALIGSGATIQVNQASTSQAGYLSSTDWNTFNGKQSALTFGSFSSPNTAITIVNGNNSTVGPAVTINIATASSGVSGLLSGTDWTTFNSKGTVSSVALSLPGIFSVSGSPVTGSGTLTATLATQTANTIFSGPTTGAAAAPTFRTLVANDIPNLTALNPGTATDNQVLTYLAGVVSWKNAPGGGSALQWVESAKSPISSTVNNILVYSFAAGDTQSLYALIKVPTSFVGTQIKLRTSVYSAASSGTNKVITTATLIRTGVDAITSTTNQQTITTTLTLGAGTVNIPQAVVSNLTDSTGKINSVQVSAGDYILVEIKRDSTDTATGDMLAPVYGTEITFT